jgi:protoporphyrinogen IX oxidase
MITALKSLHIVALILWSAGLLALPLMLERHDPQDSQARFARLRFMTQFTYIAVLTPAAVIAVAAGTALIFVRNVFEPWMFAKLAAVALLVGLHGWLGHVQTQIGESAGERQPPSAPLMIAVALAIIAAVLLLVLAKPDFYAPAFPDWLLSPRGRSLPMSETPT